MSDQGIDVAQLPRQSTVARRMNVRMAYKEGEMTRRLVAELCYLIRKGEFKCGEKVMKTTIDPRRAQFGLLATEYIFIGRLPWDVENELEQGWLG